MRATRWLWERQPTLRETFTFVFVKKNTLNFKTLMNYKQIVNLNSSCLMRNILNFMNDCQTLSTLHQCTVKHHYISLILKYKKLYERMNRCLKNIM